MKNTKTILDKVCEVIRSKKGLDLKVLDVSRVSSFTDFFVICHGQSTRQNQAICDEILERLKKEADRSPSHVEGYLNAEWILLDYLDLVVHIFSAQTRHTYKLENLWRDGSLVRTEG